MYDNTSPRYQLAQYRNPEKIQASEVLDDFLFFLQSIIDNSPTTEESEKLKAWINRYLEYDIQQVKRAEKSAWDAWTKSVQG